MKKFTPEQALKVITKIISTQSSIDDRGTVGVATGPANKGWDKDVMVWFITDDEQRGVVFPLTRDQALELSENLKVAVDLNKGLRPQMGPGS